MMLVGREQSRPFLLRSNENNCVAALLRKGRERTVPARQLAPALGLSINWRDTTAITTAVIYYPRPLEEKKGLGKKEATRLTS